jgi:hypothetical protein
MSPAEHRLFRRRVDEAWRLGRDLFEYLDYWGHLLTGAMAAKVRADALSEVADKLENLSVTDIVRRYGSTSNTALAAQAGMVALIRDLAAQEGRNLDAKPGKSSD